MVDLRFGVRCPSRILDLRERAVAAYDAGRLQSDVVQLFKISLATLKRWLAQRRAGQSLAPKTSRPGPRGAFGTPQALAALEAQLQAGAQLLVLFGRQGPHKQRRFHRRAYHGPGPLTIRPSRLH